ncbi:MAG: hypothetical protein ABI425_02990 [Patescibacteria group bacterium]
MQDFQDPNTPVQNVPNDQVQPDPVMQPSQEVFNQAQLQNDRPLAAMNAMMSQVATQPDPLNPAHPTSSVKENAPLNIEVSGEMPAGMQSVEALRTPEISPEVEKYIEQVAEEPSSFPHEVVIADQKLVQPANGFIAQPVIVLPMTQEEFEEGKKASPDTARRWLAEFTEKIQKIFGGSVLFREKTA